MALRGSEPDVWDVFVKAVGAYAQQVTMEMTKHPPDTLLRAQGMAIAINEFASVLAEAPQLHAKTMETKRGRRPATA